MERYEKAAMKVIEIKDDVITTSGETPTIPPFSGDPTCSVEMFVPVGP